MSSSLPPQPLAARPEGKQRAVGVQRSDRARFGAKHHPEHAGQRGRLAAAAALPAELRFRRAVAIRWTVHQGKLDAADSCLPLAGVSLEAQGICGKVGKLSFCVENGPKGIVLTFPNRFFPSQYNMMVESSELFVNCLEAMVETCLPVEETAPMPPSPRPYNLSSSLSSLTLGSPTDKGSSSN